jgi:hypothetical protein
MYLHFGLSRDTYTILHNNLRNQAAERKTCSILISSFQHDIKNMLAQAEWQSHNDGIQELSSLQDQITPPNSRRYGGEKASILIVVARSSPCGTT